MFKLSADGLGDFSSLLQLYGVVPEVLLFALAYAGAELKKLILWTGVLYRHSEVRSGGFVID